MRRALVAVALVAAACGQQPSQGRGTPFSELVANTADPQRIAEHAIAPASLPAFFDCLRYHDQAIVAAHRGGPAPGYAENAIETFEHTLAQALSIMEIDVARTKDGALVLMHDDTVDRTTNGAGAVSDLTLAQVQSLRLRDETGALLDAHPPTLRQALDWANGKTILELDVKRAVSYEEVVAAVHSANAQNRVIFISPSNNAAVRVHRLAPDLMIVTDMDEIADLDDLERRGVDIAHLLAWTGADEPNSALNVALTQRGVEAAFGTLGGSTSWDARIAREGRASAYAAFADTGLAIISTDRPAAAARDLDSSDGAPGYGALQCARP